MEIGSRELPVYRVREKGRKAPESTALNRYRRAQAALEQVTKHVQEIPF